MYSLGRQNKNAAPLFNVWSKLICAVLVFPPAATHTQHASSQTCQNSARMTLMECSNSTQNLFELLILLFGCLRGRHARPHARMGAAHVNSPTHPGARSVIELQPAVIGLLLRRRQRLPRGKPLSHARIECRAGSMLHTHTHTRTATSTAAAQVHCVA